MACKNFTRDETVVLKVRQAVLRSAFYLHRQDSSDRLANLRPVNSVQRQRQLRFHQSVGNPRVVALALADHGPVFFRALAEMLLGFGHLNLALRANIVLDEIFQ